MANSCYVAGKNSRFKVQGAAPAGFWDGLWHGLIAVITFIVSLFNENVSVYETHNKGKLYEFGFLLGVGVFSAKVGSHIHLH
ncbi:MAG: hypothetical protein KKH28_00940 [Elusimicrobia bacterium]|nr:hypothetical protein [Elusimicrobiota bacterium]